MTLEEIKKAIIEWQKEDESRSVLFLGVQMNDDVTKMQSAATVAGDGRALASTAIAHSLGYSKFKDGFGDFYGSLDALLHLTKEDVEAEMSKAIENDKKDRKIS